MTLLILPLATVGITIQASAGGGTDIASTTGFPIEENESFVTIQSGFRPFVDCEVDTGDIVAYDVSKGQDPSWFSTMLTDLEANGFVVREVNISTQGIPDCIVKLVVNAGLTGFSCIFTPYSNTEAALISNWVANGGALLLLSENRFCDNDKTIAVVSALGATFGGTTSFGEKVLTSGVNYDPNIPTTMWNGVNSWKIFSAREYLISNDGVVTTFANGNAAKIAKEFGDGCVVMTGNIDHLRNTIGVNGISFLDHRQLALNNFLWLNECIEREIPVEIDIKPESDPNSINVNSKGLLPVAIFGSPEFDVTQIDTTTVDFDILDVNGSTIATKCNIEDVDGDGIDDMVCFFKIEDIAHKCIGDFPIGQIQGELVDGTPFRGFDEVRWVNCKHFDPDV